jgi:hypothetical protein
MSLTPLSERLCREFEVIGNALICQLYGGSNPRQDAALKMDPPHYYTKGGTRDRSCQASAAAIVRVQGCSEFWDETWKIRGAEVPSLSTRARPLASGSSSQENFQPLKWIWCVL